ncbi:DUF551 domain-containing protein [Rhodovarius lipocyclicus]|uniref:DUF551 domain-containing protein n=1 Tax=Rhodovarius lipocyclicus TaxID=268410 RepID=UPI0038B43936
MPDNNGWLPIESAPRDGTFVLLWDRVVGLLHGWWDGKHWVHSWDSEIIPGQRDLTHWRPLPTPPGGGDDEA